MRVLVLEDDSVSQLLWKTYITDVYPSAKIIILPSVDQLALDFGSLEKVGSLFDLIVSDIFLAGDTTGLKFINTQPLEVQRRTIISSSVDAENFKDFCLENHFNFNFAPKPLNKKSVCDLLRSMAVSPNSISNDSRTPFFFGRPFQWTQNARLKLDLPVYLVTGCSSGVGAALAQKLALRDDCRVVLTARPSSLHRLKDCVQENQRLMILPLDVTDISQIRRAILTVLKRWGHIDVLINNAGVCYRSAIEFMDSDAEEIQMKTNYLGPLTLIRKVIAVMREQRKGHIINVSSVSGIMGMPTMGSYSASKHALEGLSESLWYELKPFGINVSVVRPGFINNEGYTHVASSEKAKLAEQLRGPYSKVYGFMRQFVSKVMIIAPQTSEDVAESILKLSRQTNPPLWINTTLDATFFSLLRWWLPEFLFYRMVSFFLRLSLKEKKV